MTAVMSRLLGASPVMEFTVTLMDDTRLDWQVQTYQGPRWTVFDVRRLLMRMAYLLPTPPQGGTPTTEAAVGEAAPVLSPSLPAPVVVDGTTDQGEGQWTR